MYDKTQEQAEEIEEDTEENCPLCEHKGVHITYPIGGKIGTQHTYGCKECGIFLSVLSEWRKLSALADELRVRDSAHAKCLKEIELGLNEICKQVTNMQGTDLKDIMKVTRVITGVLFDSVYPYQTKKPKNPKERD